MRELQKLAVGTTVSVGGREHRYEGFVRQKAARSAPTDAVRFVDVVTNESHTWSHDELRQIYSDGQLRWFKPYEREVDSPPDPLPDNPTDRELAEYQKQCTRQLYLVAFDTEQPARSTKALEAFAATVATTIPFDHKPPSAGTLRRMVRGRGEAGDRRLRFMSDRHARGPRAMRLSPIVEQTLREHAEAHWGEIRIRPIDVYTRARAAIVRLNEERVANRQPRIVPPSRTTVWRYLTRHLDYEKAVTRFGKREARRMFIPVRGSLQAKRILETAIIDHTRLDCMVIDDRNGLCVGRPWLTVLLDVRSRYPLSFHITFEPPSVYSAMACVRLAVRPKLEWAKRFPKVDGSWIASGVPATILTDNAWEFTGGSFADACADASISIEWCPVATPECKAIGERLFGTINSHLIHRLPGSTPFTPRRRDELGVDPVKEAQLTISQVEELIYQTVVEVYGREHNRGLGGIPQMVWLKDEAQIGFHWAHDLVALDQALTKLGPERSVDHSGLHFLGLTFRSPDALQKILLHQRQSRRPRGASKYAAKAKFKYHPEDLSKVYVWDNVDRMYRTFDCTDKVYSNGLTEHQHLVIGEYARQEELAFRSEDERCLARDRLRQRIDEMIPFGSTGYRNRAMRIETAGPDLREGDIIKRVEAEGPPRPPGNMIHVGSAAIRTDNGEPARAPRPKGRAAKRRLSLQKTGKGGPTNGADKAVRKIQADEVLAIDAALSRHGGMGN